MRSEQNDGNHPELDHLMGGLDSTTVAIPYKTLRRFRDVVDDAYERGERAANWAWAVALGRALGDPDPEVGDAARAAWFGRMRARRDER